MSLTLLEEGEGVSEEGEVEKSEVGEGEGEEEGEGEGGNLRFLKYEGVNCSVKLFDGEDDEGEGEVFPSIPPNFEFRK